MRSCLPLTPAVSPFAVRPSLIDDPTFPFARRSAGSRHFRTALSSRRTFRHTTRKFAYVNRSRKKCLGGKRLCRGSRGEIGAGRRVRMRMGRSAASGTAAARRSASASTTIAAYAEWREGSCCATQDARRTSIVEVGDLVAPTAAERDAIRRRVRRRQHGALCDATERRRRAGTRGNLIAFGEAFGLPPSKIIARPRRMGSFASRSSIRAGGSATSPTPTGRSTGTPTAITISMGPTAPFAPCFCIVKTRPACRAGSIGCSIRRSPISACATRTRRQSRR